jgi:hypothetical protein
MRLIDADAMRQDWLENGQNEYVYDTNAVLDSIDAQPTIEAEPVRHGRWVESLVIQTDISALYDYTCSECAIVSNRESNYCPNCGCRMDGGNGDEWR